MTTRPRPMATRPLHTYHPTFALHHWVFFISGGSEGRQHLLKAITLGHSHHLLLHELLHHHPIGAGEQGQKAMIFAREPPPKQSL